MVKYKIGLLVILLFMISTISAAISVANSLSADSGYTILGNYEYNNSTYEDLEKVWTPILIASAPPGGSVSSAVSSSTSFSWNVGGNGQKVTETRMATNTALNNQITITYALVNYYYTDVKVDSGGSWSDVGIGLFPVITSGSWSTDADTNGGPAQNTVYTPNYVPPSTPNLDQYPALPVQPYIGYYTGSSNIEPETCDTSQPCSFTQSDSTDLTNGVSISISVSISFIVGSVGISVPISIQSGVSSTDAATYNFAAYTDYQCDWANGIDNSITGYFVIQPTYTLTFTEQGKPSSTTPWTLTVNGHTQTTTATSISFHNINPGTAYSYTVDNIYYARRYYYPYPSSGSGTVNSNTNIQIDFSPYFAPES